MRGRQRGAGEVRASAVILATGTFLDGVIHIGSVSYGAGRTGEFPAKALASQLKEVGFSWGRFKTGTPPRLKGSTVNFAAMAEDSGDDLIRPFSLRTPSIERPRLSCFRTYTCSDSRDCSPQLNEVPSIFGDY
jgi:tRNA uridine 5-carboxymethylaminomethyl modification enzyme